MKELFQVTANRENTTPGFFYVLAYSIEDAIEIFERLKGMKYKITVVQNLGEVLGAD